MGRPRIVRKAEEAKAIPADQPIQVEITPEGVVDIPSSEVPLGVKPPEKPVPEQKPEIKQEITAKPPKEEPQEDVTTLKAQLAEIKKAAEESNRRAQEAAQREAAFRQEFEKQQVEFRTASTRAGQAELDAVNNAIAAATSELASAKSELKAAGDAGDWGAIADAQERIAEAKTRVVQLGDAKAHLTERAERLKNMKPEQLAPAGDPVENYINNLQASPKQKDWLRSHREVLTDNYNFNKLNYVHAEALKQGKISDSPEYYQFIEEQMGYRKPDAKIEDDDDAGAESPPAIFSAPPSREAPSAETGRPTTTRITLTAAQREAARDAGVDEVTYAKNLLLLQQRKKEGHYTEH